MSDTKPHREYFPALDGLRGIAILLVLFSHHFSFFPYTGAIGYYGVDLFFVLSGFLITDILLRTRNRGDYFKSFYYRRALRIFPVYYLILLLFFLGGPFLDAVVTQYDYYRNHWPMLWFHLNNFLIIFYPNDSSGRVFVHFWSLSLEEQFYLIWPFLVYWITPGRKMVAVIISVIAVTIIGRFIIWYQLEEGYVYWSAINNLRIDCLATGALLALLRFLYPGKFQTKFIAFVFAILLLHVVILTIKFLFVPAIPHYLIIGITSFCGVAGLLIIYCIKPGSTGSFFANPVLKFTGKISYGLYIYHFPVYVLGKNYLEPLFTPNRLTTTMIGLITACIAFGISTVSYYYFERRFLELKKLV